MWIFNIYTLMDPSLKQMRINTPGYGKKQPKNPDTISLVRSLHSLRKSMRNFYVQVGVADEYIAVVDVNRYRSDMDYFIPLMNKFYTTYGLYPKYPVTDAGYGSYNNYIFCEQQGMEKYMKFPMFKKETTDKKYHEDPFRAVNFPIGEDGIMR